MKRVIKITESQLIEAEGDAFHYIDTSDDSHPFNGQSTITAQGKIDGEENAEPIFTDRIGKQRTPQAWARYRLYGNINNQPHARANNIQGFNEGVSLAPSKANDEYSLNDNGIDDFTEKNAYFLGDNEQNLFTMIPSDVNRVTDRLIKLMNDHNLKPKQIASVLSKILSCFPTVSQNSSTIKTALRQQIFNKR